MRAGVGIAAIVAAMMIMACGGGDDTSPTTSPFTITPTPQATGNGISAAVVTSDLGVGPNRFAVGVIDDSESKPILNAQTHLRFLKILSGNQAQARSEADATFVGFQTFYIDEQTQQQVVTGDTGVYVTNAVFDETGDWGVQITGTANGTAFGPINLAFTVLPHGDTLSPGDPAPKSRQTIASDVSDINQIDSMSPHDPLHDVTVADAISSGKPVVVLFGTPAFCETRTCAPVMTTALLPLYEQYKDSAVFIHIEPYFLPELRSGAGFCAVPAFNLELARAGTPEGSGPCPKLTEDQLTAAGEGWNLTTEPILFVIDKQGTIAGKFEGIFGKDEVDAVLRPLL
jgi:hypothetical protein